MQIEIWSDVVCPSCYIGQRQLEAALEQWPDRDRVQVRWRSSQLGPDTRTDPSRNAIQNLAEKKGWTLEFTRQAVADVANRAQAVGLTFDYERTKVASTFDAHRPPCGRGAARPAGGRAIRHQLGAVLRARPPVRSERSAGQRHPAAGPATGAGGHRR